MVRRAWRGETVLATIENLVCCRCVCQRLASCVLLGLFVGRFMMN